MKFTVDSKEFLSACTKVEKAASTKTTLPVIGGILIKTIGDDKISLCCYNLEFAISTTIKADVEDSGETCIVADTLINILKQLNGCVTLTETGKQTINLSGLNSNYTLMSFDTREFPELPNTTAEEGFDINAKDFAEMVKQTIFAVAEDVAKGAHTGVKFELSKDNLKLIALDGYRFAVRTHPIAYYDDHIDFVVPKKALNEIASIAASADCEMAVEKCKQHVIFTIGDYKVVSKLQVGDFLDYARAIPNNFKFDVKVPTKELLTNINRCAVILNDGSKAPIRLAFDNDKINLAIETSLNKVKADMDIDYAGESFAIGLNHKFLKEALDACKDDEQVTLSFCNPNSPMTVSAPRKTYLILPVRL